MLHRGMVLRAGGGRGPTNPWQQVVNKFSKKAMQEATSKAKAFAKTANAQQVVQSVARTAAVAEQAARAQFSKLQEQFNNSGSKNNNNNNSKSSSSSSSSGGGGGSSSSGGGSKKDSPFAAFWEFLSSLSAKMGPHFRKIVESLGVTMTVSLLYYLYNTSHGLMAAFEGYKENVRRKIMRESHLQEVRESMEDSSDDTYASKNGGQQHNFGGEGGGITADRDSGTSHGLQKAMSGNNDEEALRQRLQRRDDRRRKRTAEEDGVSYYDEGNTKRLEEEQMNRPSSSRGLEQQKHQKSRTELLATSLLREAEEDTIRQQLDVSTQQSYYVAGGSAKAKVEDGNRRKDNRRAMSMHHSQHVQKQLALHAKRKAHDVETMAGMSQEEYDKIFKNSFFFRFGNAPLDHSVMPAAGHNMQSATKDKSLLSYGNAPGQGQLPTVTPNFNEYTNGGFRTAEMAGTAASVHAPSGRYLSGVGIAFQVRCLKKMDGYMGTAFAARKLENLNRKAPPGFVMDPLSGRFSRIETLENSGIFTGGIEGNEAPSFDFRHSMSM